MAKTPPTLSADIDRLKRRASSVSLGANATLTVLKIVAATLTGSISLISESIHSITDVFASLIAFFSVRASGAPPDEDHPYGHGKIESLASFGESILLFLVVAYIFKESIERLKMGAQVHRLQIGMWIMSVSAATSLVVGPYIRRISERTDSIALRSNGRHVMIDFWTSAGVLAALAITQSTGWKRADAWFAMALGVWIAVNAFAVGRESVQQLIDRRVSDDEIETIHRILHGTPGLISFHQLRSRHSGNVHYVDVHVVVPNDWSVVRGHKLADDIEKAIESALQPAQAVVHIDPFDPDKASSVPVPN